jgi:hypothetical protein
MSIRLNDLKPPALPSHRPEAYYRIKAEHGPLKRAGDSAARAGGAIERFIARTLALRLEELAGEIRGLRDEMQQFDKRHTETLTSLRNEVVARIEASERCLSGRIEALDEDLSDRIDSLTGRIDTISKRGLASERHVDDRLVAMTGDWTSGLPDWMIKSPQRTNVLTRRWTFGNGSRALKQARRAETQRRLEQRISSSVHGAVR